MADERNNHQTMENVNGVRHGAAMRSWAEKWLSGERLAPYLEQCDGDIDRALELYKWNAALGQLLMRDIFHFEVALRNAYNDVMESRWDGEGHWLFDDASPARRPVMSGSSAPSAVNSHPGGWTPMPSGFSICSAPRRRTICTAAVRCPWTRSLRSIPRLLTCGSDGGSRRMSTLSAKAVARCSAR